MRSVKSPLHRRTRSATAARRSLWAALVLALLANCSGCRSVVPVLTAPELENAIAKLDRPLPADLVALYALRVPSSSGLRLSVRTSGATGRLTVSEPFGSAVSITAWDASRPPIFFDLREGCRLEASDLSQVLGVPALPLPEAVNLLGGRLPSSADDFVSARDDGRILVEGPRWAAFVEVASEPWRVVSVEDARGGRPGWHLELSEHAASVPGKVRIQQKEGRWAELELIRLEWNDGEALPGLPDLPPCILEPSP